ncbi:MAG: SCO7613 C-terminal domain-containing membrane protein [Microcella sp.]
MRPFPAPGTASFPRSENDLRSTEQCPACFTPLRAVVCQACGLNLAHPLAGELAALSTSIADQLDDRLRLIDRIRREPVTPAPQAAPAAAPPAPPVAVPPAATPAVAAADPGLVETVPAAAPAPAPAPAAAPEPAVAASAPAASTASVPPRTEPDRPRRSGIQIALVIVGIALLSVFALFGVIYVFIAYGVVARSVIIALASLATLVVASVLARRGLASTAEGLAALGTVVLVLDAWAVRRTDVAGLAAAPEAAYWGVALLVVATVCLVWARAGGHRSPLLVGANLVPIGAALIAVHLVAELPRGAAPAAGALAAAAAAVAVLAASRRAFATSHSPLITGVTARTPLISMLVASVAALAGVVLLSGETWWWAATVAVAMAFLLGIAAWVLTGERSGPIDAAVAATSSALAALVLVTGLVIATGATASAEATLAVALLAPATVVAVGDVTRVRTERRGARIAIGAAAMSAGVAAAVSTTIALSTLVYPLIDAGLALDTDRSVTADVLDVEAFTVTALVGLVAVIALLTLSSRLIGRLTHPARALPLAVAAGVSLALVSATMPAWWALMALAAVISIGASAALWGSSAQGDSALHRAARLGLSVAAVAAALIAAGLGWAIDGGWWVGIVTALTALAVGRRATAHGAARAIAGATSGLLVVASAPSLATIIGVDAFALTLIIAAAVVVLVRLSTPDPAERSLVVVSVIPVGTCVLLAQVFATAPTAGALPAIGTLAFLIAVIVGASDARGYGRFAGLAVVAVAAVVVTDRVMIDAVAASAAAPAVSPHQRALIALVVLALVSTVAAYAARGTQRRWIDVGTIVVATAALIPAIDGSFAPLAVLTTAVIGLALATRGWSSASSSLRILAAAVTLFVAVIALALFLDDVTARSQSVVVLPLGAVLLALVIALRATTPAAGHARSVPAAVAALIVVALGPSVAVALSIEPAATTVLLAALALGLTRLPARTVAERAATVAAAAPVSLVLAIVMVTDGGDRSLLAAGACAALLLGLIAIATDARVGIDRIAVFAALGPAVALLAVQGVRTGLSLGDTVNVISDAQLALVALSAVTTLAAIGALTTRGRERRALDIGLVVVAVPSAVVVTTGGQTSLGLTISAVALLALAISRDGLFGSQSPRRYLGWLALASATAALWALLLDRGVDNPEPYTLPLAGALLVIALLLGRTSRPATAAPTVSGPTVIAVSALAVAGIPLAAIAGDGPVARGASVGVAATALALAVIIGRVRSGERWQGLSPLLLGVSVITQLVLTISVISTVMLDALSSGRAPVGVPHQVAAVLIVIMLIGTAAATWVTLPSNSDAGVPRTVSVTAAATAGGAALVAGAIGLVGAMEQVELISVPLALGLLLIGTFELDRRATARSMPWLTPGLVALLLPSLVAVDVDGGLWRVAALGIAATIILIGGVVRRLKAPFLVGAVALLTHVVIQTWPLIARIGQSIEWWLWLGIAGVAIVAVAARYERRVQNVKNTVRRISELR